MKNSVGTLLVNDHGKVQVGNTYTTVYNDNSSNQSSCVADLRITDPRDDKTRIEQTKGGLLRDSYRWILNNNDYQRWRDSETSRLLWIKGDAGKGKTMLLCGIIDELTTTKEYTSKKSKTNFLDRVSSRVLCRLGKRSSLSTGGELTYFFCQGTDSRLNHATAVLRGLMYLLLLQQPALVSHIQTGYDHAGRQLFESEDAVYTLSRALSSMLSDRRAKGCYLIVDALDECQTNLPQLLDFIARNASIRSHVKWIVSSRNRPDIEQYLRLNDSNARIRLELNHQHVAQSINTFIDYKVPRFEALRENIPLQQELQAKLREKADGTFLWAALVIHELQRVQSWAMLDVLEQTPSGLIPLYARMMEHISKLRPQDSELCRLAISTVTIAYRPLSLHELGVLCDGPASIVDDVSSIARMIDMCGSFLTVRDGIVYLIHQSVKDYILAEASNIIFKLGVESTHHTMAIKSLECMRRTLGRNIYNLPRLSARADEVNPPNHDPLVRVRYSCIYWVDHLAECQRDQDPQGRNLVTVFLERNYLHWLESLSLFRNIPKGILSMSKLVSLVQGGSETSYLVDLVRDGLRVIRYFKTAIETYPLQVYVSVLVFAPKKSRIRQLNWKEAPQWIVVQPGIEDEWDACFQTLEVHQTIINKAVFSHDGTQIVSGSDRGGVKLWDAVTGQCMNTFEEDGKMVNSVAFSADGRHIAFSSADSTIKVCETATGRRIFTFKGHTMNATSALFSHDGTRVVSGSDDYTVKIWDTATGQCVHTFESPTDGFRPVELSPDGIHLALATVSGTTLQLWDSMTGRCVHTFEGHFKQVFSVVFSPDGTRVASAVNAKTIKIWDKRTGQCIHTLEQQAEIEYVSFSPDGKRVASALTDGTVEIWCTETGGYLQTLDEGCDKRQQHIDVSFSPNGSQLLVTPMDKVLKLWDPATGRVQSLKGHSASIKSAVFSPDGTQIASTSLDGTIKLWDTRAKYHTNDVEESHDRTISLLALSPDKLQVATTSEDKTAKFWDVATGRCLQTIELDCAPFFLDFEGPTLVLNKYNRSIRREIPSTITPTSSTLPAATKSGCNHVYSQVHHDPWITKDSERVLWLPPEYRLTMARDSIASTFAMMNASSGRILVITLYCLEAH